MQNATSTSTSAKRKPPIKKVASKKPLSKAQVNSIPKPVSGGKGSARTLYKYSGKMPKVAKGFTPQMLALIITAKEAKKAEINSASFTAQDLVKLAVKNGNLTTNQDPLRIFRFYAKRLVEEGYFVKVK
jgi:hypothetical protein|tara:strand:- start:1565 stop:1951 length:387 start_codon:yes stop_codon:yes gene_type:complete